MNAHVERKCSLVSDSPLYSRLAGQTLKGKVAIITGAAGGIGSSIAEHFAAAEASVMIADIAAEGAARVAERICAEGGSAASTAVDITDSASAKAMVAATVARFGEPDILVHAAAMDAPRGIAWELDDEHWRTIIDTNLSGAFWCAKAVIPGMIARRQGRIIFISSVSAKVGQLDTTVAYNASKAGLIGLTIGLAKQLEQHNVLVNAVAPGSTGTGEPMNEREIAEEAALYPLPIVGPAPIAHACLYLAQDSGSWTSGTFLNVSGGRLHG
jgi:NAD(P)-dependent dehydrogenase (short-subunit alcohol dehydrogenase family)